MFPNDCVTVIIRHQYKIIIFKVFIENPNSDTKSVWNSNTGCQDKQILIITSNIY